MEKYFHDPEKTPAEMLYCSSPIILEIPNLEIVTTSMLFSAQQTILQKIEQNWFKKFCDTFPDKEQHKNALLRSTMKKSTLAAPNGRETLLDEIGFGSENLGLIRGLRASLYFNEKNSPFKQQMIVDQTGLGDKLSTKSKLFRSWIALSNWFRSAAKFIQCMHIREEYNLFSSFLARVGKKGIPGTVTDSQGTVMASNTDLQRQARTSEDIGYTDNKDFQAKQVICGQLITLANLQHDLDFWIETDRFKDLYRKRSSECEVIDNAAVQNKATIIKDLFLDPQINIYSQDAEYLNVPKDICEEISSSIDSGIIDKTIFVDAVSYIFPVLIHFWKIYRESFAVTVYKRWVELAAEIRKQRQNHRKLGIINKPRYKENQKAELMRLRRQRISMVPVLNRALNNRLSNDSVLTSHGKKMVENGEAIIVGSNIMTRPLLLRKSCISKQMLIDQKQFKDPPP